MCSTNCGDTNPLGQGTFAGRDPSPRFPIGHHISAGCGMDLVDRYVFTSSLGHLIFHRGQRQSMSAWENWLGGHGRLLKWPPALLELFAVVKMITLLPNQAGIAVIRRYDCNGGIWNAVGVVLLYVML